MSAEKTERLINLTLGLLSSKRFLTKSEIFRNVAGYSGSPETMERMFERDKDELRSMGIEIEVGQIDPLFEDEVGYLIKSSNIQIQPDDFTKEELLLMTIAANIWKESVFAEVSQSALMKLASIDSTIGNNKVTISTFNEDGITLNIFQKIIDAISGKRYLRFTYNGSERSVAPYALKSLNGYWYLIGEEKGSHIKVFKIIRIQSEITVERTPDSFEIPSDFNVDEFLKFENQKNTRTATLLIRENRVLALRNKGKLLPGDNGWERLQINFDDTNDFIKEILWFGDDVVVESPHDLREKIKSLLEASTNG